ncbi:hypothetical protein HanXRQr2_Chr09g0407431 [Helianthus annuus]|uniref:Uncharacterized protein n=1 Tax=Helianthus annuus TaxID=4232 RepID=A0A9K3I986_HELAN|nr:hypothetical protein HanXRQr2_Chr09g0407431 [Helianthus annuus]
MKNFRSVMPILVRLAKTNSHHNSTRYTLHHFTQVYLLRRKSQLMDLLHGSCDFIFTNMAKRLNSFRA